MHLNIDMVAIDGNCGAMRRAATMVALRRIFLHLCAGVIPRG
jgi:hypothetical protein